MNLLTKTIKEMKSVQLTLIMLMMHLTIFSQQTGFNEIESSQAIPVSDIKTTHLILKDKIKYLDLGSRYFVTDTIGNVIKIKHIGGDFVEKEEEKKTNITIITLNGDYYAIPLFFDRDIKTTTYKLGYSDNNIASITRKNNDAELYEMCHFSKKAPSNYNIKGNRDLLLSKVSGIYYRGDHIAVRLEVKNFSTIDLDIDHILFRFIKNKRYAPDVVYQERVLRPIQVCNSTTKVRGTGGIEIFTFVFNKFTPNVDEDLQIEILEQNGGRSTTIEIPRKKLLNPKVI